MIHSDAAVSPNKRMAIELFAGLESRQPSIELEIGHQSLENISHSFLPVDS